MDQVNLAATNLQYALGLVGVFTAVFLLVAAINYLLVEPLRQRRKLQQRLKASARELEVRAQIFKDYQEIRQGPLMSLMEGVAGWSKIENLQRQLLQADIYLTPTTFLCMVGILGSIGFILGMTLGKMLLWGLGGGFSLGLAPVLLLRWKKRRKSVLFEKQMPEAMELLARSMRAGHTLAGTLELVSQEIPPPLGMEMRITYEEQRLGLSVIQALRRMGERVDSRDLRYFVTAVLIQSETGGNLAEILENIGMIVRERLKLKGKIRGLTAEGRFSAIILGLLPVGTFIIIFLLNREHMLSFLRDPLGVKLLGVGLINLLLGAIVMKKMVNIKV
ncbi:MAG: type II secretion system F family protein [Desulfobaccales bacterium]|nr:type II secretion system F family protein [Desulfobaccales bacterium]